ncbi:hypothetical protein VP01_136g7 [Puccinia sorghi]|uniref:Uncharacterized protein n=1 Tax=Puccinia sorghi TaxID=27349 RepID=A0A0L6VLP7_9BASI|nr:hypothetical protein VP01_136g7 [Puccinia sorghi]
MQLILKEKGPAYYMQVTRFDKVVMAGRKQYVMSFTIAHLIQFTKEEDQLEGLAEWTRWGSELPIIVTDDGFKCYVGGDADIGIDCLVRRFHGGQLSVSTRVADYRPSPWPPLPKNHAWKI